MAFAFQTPLIWVGDQKTFQSSLNDLRAAERIGVDTESNSLHAYREQVCLIQFSTSQKDYLVDPLAGFDLNPLAAVFTDDRIEKIFHAAEYDIICLKRDFGFGFSNLFDTMQAARVLGLEKLGLSSLLTDLFSINQGKSFQKANWAKRPLDEAMRAYARLDTHYLSQLRDALMERLELKGLLDLAREDFDRLCRVEPNHRDVRLYAAVSGYHYLKPQSLRVLDELCRFRDRTARKMNRPLFKVIGNSALLAVAKARPKTTAELNRVENLSPRIAERYSRELLSAVERGASLPPISIEKRKRPSQSYLDRLDALHGWRKKAARKMGVQSDIILPRDALEEIAGAHPRTQEELRPLMRDIPWRYRHFSHDIIKAMQTGKTK